jgi:hypothetical protein
VATFAKLLVLLNQIPGRHANALQGETGEIAARAAAGDCDLELALSQRRRDVGTETRALMMQDLHQRHTVTEQRLRAEVNDLKRASAKTRRLEKKRKFVRTFRMKPQEVPDDPHAMVQLFDATVTRHHQPMLQPAVFGLTHAICHGIVTVYKECGIHEKLASVRAAVSSIFDVEEQVVRADVTTRHCSNYIALHPHLSVHQGALANGCAVLDRDAVDPCVHLLQEL